MLDMQSLPHRFMQVSKEDLGLYWPLCCLNLSGLLHPILVLKGLCVVTRQVKVKLLAHAALICCVGVTYKVFVALLLVCNQHQRSET